MSVALIDAVQDLFLAYPGRDIQDGSIRVYVQDLGEMNEAMVIAAITKLRRTNKFVPTIAEIRRLVVEAVCAIPTEDEAWTLLKKQIAKPRGEGWDLPEAVAKVVRTVGTSHEFRTDESPQHVMENRFRKAWGEYRERNLADAQAGTVALASIAEPALVGIGGGL